MNADSITEHDGGQLCVGVASPRQARPPLGHLVPGDLGDVSIAPNQTAAKRRHIYEHRQRHKPHHAFRARQPATVEATSILGPTSALPPGLTHSRFSVTATFSAPRVYLHNWTTWPLFQRKAERGVDRRHLANALGLHACMPTNDRAVWN